MSDGPYLILAAFWQDTDTTDEVAEAVGRVRFPQPDGCPRGAVVSFRREVATRPRFLADLARFDLDGLAPTRARDVPPALVLRCGWCRMVEGAARVETVPGRGHGWKCLRCGWWNWIRDAS